MVVFKRLSRYTATRKTTFNSEFKISERIIIKLKVVIIGRKDRQRRLYSLVRKSMIAIIILLMAQAKRLDAKLKRVGCQIRHYRLR